MLNAELKSMNSNLTYVSVLSRCVRAGWRAVAMASSVERLDLYANWKGSREGGRTDLMCCMTNRSKHFMRIGVSAPIPIRRRIKGGGGGYVIIEHGEE